VAERVIGEGEKGYGKRKGEIRISLTPSIFNRFSNSIISEGT